MKAKKVLTTVLAAAALFTCTAMPVSAAEYKTDLMMTIDATPIVEQMNVTLPLKVPVTILADGSAVVPSDYSMTNNSSKSIKVTKIVVMQRWGWNVTRAADPVKESDIRVGVNGYYLGTTAPIDWVIGAGTTLALPLDIKAGPQSESFKEHDGLGIEYTVEWAN